jgi:hypothetical protein
MKGSDKLGDLDIDGRIILKMDLLQAGWRSMGWIYLAQYRRDDGLL